MELEDQIHYLLRTIQRIVCVFVVFRLEMKISKVVFVCLSVPTHIEV